MERRLPSEDEAFCFCVTVEVCLPQLLRSVLNIQMVCVCVCVGVDTPVVLE